MTSTKPDHDYLAMAARLALRGHGGAEPNPLVGCVIVEPGGDIVGWGYHRRCGGPHAEIDALRRADGRATGATAYVTLEPCNHIGRTGPCSEALIDAGVARVVYARSEPDEVASGGGSRLRQAGVAVEVTRVCRAAVDVSSPFVHRICTGLPWVTVKWAQTVDGRIATRRGESRWISNAASRRLVHRKRGCVDAIMTGIGTVLADDPALTARGVRRRRTAQRVVVDPRLEIPLESRLVTSTDHAPTIVACDRTALETHGDRASQLEAAGVELLAVTGEAGELPLSAILRELVARHETTHLLVEAGAGLLGRLFRQRLVNEAWVFVAPLLFGDDEAIPCVRGLTTETLTDGCRMDLWNVRRRGDDVLLQYGVKGTGPRG